LGRTVAGDRVRDIAATTRYLAEKHGPGVPLVVLGTRAAGLLGAYAALLDPNVQTIGLVDPPASHMDRHAPALLNVLRVLDVPEALGMLAPRRLELRGGDPALRQRVQLIYARAGAAQQFAQ
jgi:hypothetical protein